ncbi:hypothetical protein CEP54_003317 [Fusarium duplospermum]|uniref:Uncharacterized protein n=1 Tax=Fusarium duplospermum TaxID=1325734 RepID=A0A428QPF4_9HYPO|nr:hypothetical protein CEP54_003317 [Fusarium duplospermum]
MCLFRLAIGGRTVHQITLKVHSEKKDDLVFMIQKESKIRRTSSKLLLDNLKDVEVAHIHPETHRSHSYPSYLCNNLSMPSQVISPSSTELRSFGVLSAP